MKVQTFIDFDEWFVARNGKITGSRLADVTAKKTGAGKKIGYYELVAERLSISEEDCEGYVPNETPREWGSRTQKHAVDRFEKETGKKVDTSLVLWMREDNEDIAVSPDGVISESEALETKCLSSARHTEAYLTKKLPTEYEMQVLQYFIVNDKLQKMNIVFYDPRLPAIQYLLLEVLRSDVQHQIDEYLTYEKELLAEIEELVKSLNPF